MLRFNPDQYYSFTRENEFSNYAAKSPEDNDFANFYFFSRELLANYYSDKYSCRISVSQDVDFCHFLPAKLNELRSTTQNKAGDDRVAFNFGCSHSVTVVYLKENGHELLLYSDSVVSGMSKVAALKLQEDTGLPVYWVATSRQGDSTSCHLDSIIQCRIATAKTKKTGFYLVPSFLTQMVARSAEKKADVEDANLPIRSLDEDDDQVEFLEAIKPNTMVEEKKGNSRFFVDAKLPDECLITSQYKEFVRLHKEEKSRVIHTTKEGEPENLSQFLTRYQILLKSRKIINGYTRKKTLKLTLIVEIQFYINQLKPLLGSKWTDEVCDQFVELAKIKFKEQKCLFDFANTFFYRMKPAYKAPFFELRKKNRKKVLFQPRFAPVKSTIGNKI